MKYKGEGVGGGIFTAESLQSLREDRMYTKGGKRKNDISLHDQPSQSSSSAYLWTYSEKYPSQQRP